MDCRGVRENAGKHTSEPVVVGPEWRQLRRGNGFEDLLGSTIDMTKNWFFSIHSLSVYYVSCTVLALGKDVSKTEPACMNRSSQGQGAG